jgi:drug/metabolite transporter (DMT)-like permease
MHPSVQAYSPRQALAILVLAIANTSCAFFLWTRAQSVLYAFEKTVLHNAILPFSAVFAYLALGEGASFGMCVGILLLFSGALLAQKRAPWEKP